ncbi:hypothetical protein IFM89_029732 [Coptis chinensis]|uniref:Cullin N-terminal domain-containing protein n=1 Tax=Coptis chinensis TaxID=261450 RepID=A0A835I640_9MAGN|nr:hypothetical protein IFM89_029732 [Coptis chinensis]
MLTKISIMAPQSERKVIELEEGWELMQKGVTKLKNILVGVLESQFNSGDYMTLYTTIYNMCIQRPPHDYSEQLHDRYKTVFEDYIAETVLQSIQEKHDEYMLKELVQRWNNHKVMLIAVAECFTPLISVDSSNPLFLKPNFAPPPPCSKPNLSQ